MKKFLLLLSVAFGLQQLNAQVSLTLNHTDAVCNNTCTGTITANATGGTPPYTYQWTPNISSTNSATNVCPGTYVVQVTDQASSVSSATVNVMQPTAIVVSFTNVVNATCGAPNGSATVIASGGVSPYTYAWNTTPVQTSATATNLNPGNYSCTVTDATGCVVLGTVTIFNIPGPTASISSTTPITCNASCNGSATVSLTGGTAPYTFSWLPAGGNTPTISNACAGNYTVTVTDNNGCTSTAIASITQPPALTISVSTTATACNMATGSATATPSGGTGPYSYSWSNSATTPTITNLSAGNYTVTVTDANGCTATAITTIANTPGPTAGISSTTPSTCYTSCDGGASSSVSGGVPPYVYSWAPSGATSASIGFSCPGLYTVTVTDQNGCYSTAVANITSPPAVTLTVTPVNPTICSGASVTLSCSGATTYVWYPGNMTGASVVVTPAFTTTYTITGTSPTGCTGTNTVTVSVNQNPTITVTSSNNPSCFGGSDGNIITSSSGGTPPYSCLWNPSNAITGNLTNIPAGTYGTIITDVNGCVGTGQATTLTDPPQLFVTPGSMTPAGCNFSNGSADVSATGGTGTYSVNWSPSGNNTWLASNLPAGTETVTVTDMNGCTATTAVTVTDSCDYVWPGDANDDAVADNNDILDIGIANGATGTTRANASLTWIGQPSANWGQTLLSGTDYKFVDCNGDGVIDPNDTTAVIQNFGFTHNNRTGGIPVYDQSLPDLTITMGQSILASNSQGAMTVSLGNSTMPASNVYGIAFTLNFDAAQIDAASFRMNENGTWMGTPGNDMMGVVLNSGTGTGAVKIAITRLDHQNVNGFGDIANVGFMTTSDLVGSGNTQNVNFTISDVTVISANETPQTVNTVNDSVTVSDPALMMGISANENQDAISVYPNPFSESVEILLPSAAKTKTCELVITDAAGRVVRTEQVKGNSFVMQRGAMDAGIYICSIRCEGQMIANTKLVVR